MRILILGGTGSARLLADRLVAAGHQVTSSLAGVTRNARLPSGQVRTGGFGGVEGLKKYLASESVEALINATHPFAAQMNLHAVRACQEAGVPNLRLTRESWAKRADAGGWLWAGDHVRAAHLAARIPGTVLLTVGRQHSDEYYARLAGRRVLCRVTLAPDTAVPDGWELLVDRGPFNLAAERRLFTTEQIAVLITKDSGGEQTAAKLTAAGESGTKVIMVSRPPLLPDQQAVTSINQALAWLDALGEPGLDCIG